MAMRRFALSPKRPFCSVSLSPQRPPTQGFKKPAFSVKLEAGADLDSTCLVKSVLRAEVSVTS